MFKCWWHYFQRFFNVSLHSSPLRFVFFLPNFQNLEPLRPFVKQHMKSPSWFSAALGASYSRYRYLASTDGGVGSCSSVNFGFLFDVLLHTTLSHLSKIPPTSPSFAGPSLSCTRKDQVGSLSSCYVSFSGWRLFKC